jgi:hypothetical protein
VSDPYNNVGSKMAPPTPATSPAPAPQPDWYKIRKIVRLAGWNPAIRVDPVQVAAATLEKAKAGRIKSLFVSIIWNDETLAYDYSEMKNSELTAHAYNVQSEVHNVVTR